MNPLVTKRCSPIEEAIYKEGFRARAALAAAKTQGYSEQCNFLLR